MAILKKPMPRGYENLLANFGKPKSNLESNFDAKRETPIYCYNWSLITYKLFPFIDTNKFTLHLLISHYH